VLHCCEIFQNKGYGDGEDIGLLRSGIPRKQGVLCRVSSGVFQFCSFYLVWVPNEGVQWQ
jgi:hypothetical protein